MKKLATIFALLALCVFTASFAACSASGTYKFYSVIVEKDGVTTEYKAGKEYDGAVVPEDAQDGFILNGDEGYTVSDLSGNEQSGYSWAEKDGKVSVYTGSETIIYVKKGKYLLREIKGDEFSVTYVYKR